MGFRQIQVTRRGSPVMQSLGDHCGCSIIFEVGRSWKWPRTSSKPCNLQPLAPANKQHNAPHFRNKKVVRFPCVISECFASCLAELKCISCGRRGTCINRMCTCCLNLECSKENHIEFWTSFFGMFDFLMCSVVCIPRWKRVLRGKIYAYAAYVFPIFECFNRELACGCVLSFVSSLSHLS